MVASTSTSGAGGMQRPVAYVDRPLETLIPRFLQRRRDDADLIESLVARGDFATIMSMAHSIKGSGGGYGFDPITEYGSAIERAAAENDGPSVLASARNMRDYADVVDVVFIDD